MLSLNFKYTALDANTDQILQISQWRYIYMEQAIVCHYKFAYKSDTTQDR